ncbi:MAG: ABC transporter ATP-binding protein [Chloroflexi bacterium]|nr:ABC transporter ATP-binding protein [Chloroflexota bacterium]
MGGHVRQSKPKGSSIEILRRMLGLFAPFKGQFVAVLALVVVTVALSLTPALLLGEIVDEATSDGGTAGDRSRIILLASIGAAVYVAAGLLGVLRAYITQIIGQGVMYNLRIALHAHLQRLSVRFFTNTKTGEILSRVMTDVTGIQQVLTGTFTEFFTNVMTLGLALAIMFSIEWRMALLLTVLLPLWVYPTIRVGRVQRRLQMEWQEEAAEMSGQLEETLSVSGAMLVKTFGRQEHEAQKFEQSSQVMRSVSIQRMMAGRWFNLGTELFGSLSIIMVYALGGIAAIGGDVSIGEVVAFAVLAQRVFQPFQGVMRINTTVLSSLALFERIFEYMDLPAEVDESPNAVRLDRPSGKLEFRDVSFAYTSSLPLALDGVSFTLERGQMLALVGPSGAGKTTITYLLQRFYDPTNGSVLLDGHDLRDVTLDSISDAIGTVMQDAYLFHTTLANNIRYGRLEASDRDVAAAASAAGLDDMIERLPERMETIVGERGYRLSGGEKQRVAIARAILKDPAVLILDEATASLDSRLEREVREATAKLAEDRTTVVIAHRLSTVVAADQILVLDVGRVVEQDRHEELLANGGLYASLYNEQFNPTVAEPAVAEQHPR